MPCTVKCDENQIGCLQRQSHHNPGLSSLSRHLCRGLSVQMINGRFAYSEAGKQTPWRHLKLCAPSARSLEKWWYIPQWVFYLLPLTDIHQGNSFPNPLLPALRPPFTYPVKLAQQNPFKFPAGSSENEAKVQRNEASDDPLREGPRIGVVKKENCWRMKKVEGEGKRKLWIRSDDDYLSSSTRTEM